MAFKRGGDYAVETAIKSKEISTCEFDSGIQVSGIFSDLIKTNNQGVYLKTLGPTSLSYQNIELSGHGIEYHSEGFGAPIGRIINFQDVNVLKNKLHNNITIKYDVGITVSGTLINYVENEDGRLLILSFSNCSVLLRSDSEKNIDLFQPDWGVFDLVIGNSITSAFPFPADRKSFQIKKREFKSKTIRPVISKETQDLNELYLIVRNMRNNQIDRSELINVLNKLKTNHKNDWLLSLEICEISKGVFNDIFKMAYSHLMNLTKIHLENKKYILDGLKLLK